MVAMKKRLIYFASAVVATAFAASCAKEELSDGNLNKNENPEIEITGQVFEATSEGTKSVIVGKTPTWVEGDAIAVFGSNESEGAECTFAGEGKFQTSADKAIEGPFYAIYPYKEGHTVDQQTGIFTASVPAEQTIKAGENVAQGALVSVATSETPSLYFRNAVGLIRIENQREDIVSIKIESTNAEQMLAGTFTMDLDPDKEAEGEDPAVTPVAGTGVAAITLKPAEENGTFAAGELYAAVLPTTLDGIKVTFERKGETENETAIVTKTAAVELKRNGGANLGSFFTYEIKNAQELLAWNKACAKWTAWDVVTLTDNIDCKDVIDSKNWTPNEFTGTFDGNEKTIKNFVIEIEGPAAFFGVTNNAHIKNLTFDEGCSFTTKGVTVKEGIWTTADRQYAASLVCDSKGATVLENIINYGSVSATTASASNGNYLGGICAYLDSTEDVSNCINHGTITYSANTTSSWVNVSGCFGHVTKNITLTNCENHGKVQFTGANSGNKSLNLAGITGGCNSLTLSGCKNLGTIDCNATASHYGGTNIGGLIGLVNSNITLAFENCTNGEINKTLGSLTNTSESTGRISIGGCVGYITGSTDPQNAFFTKASVSNFKNYGPITNKGIATSNVSMGGVIGQIDLADGSAITNVENHGNITHATADMTSMTLHMGGIIGFVNKSAITIGDATKEAADIKNYGKIQSSKKSKQFGLGGIIGRINSTTTNVVTIQNCSNELTATASQTGWLQTGNVSGVGGIVGMVHATKSTTGAKTNILSCTNAAEVKKDGQGLQSNFHVGGIVGNITEKASDDANVTVTAHKVIISSCENTGNVSMSDNNYGRSSNWCYTGGVVGYFGYSSGEVKECINRGKVSNYFWSKTDGCVRIGGITGNAVNQTYVNCKNYGTVSEESKSVQCDAGGIIGRVANGAIKITNCDNFGDLQSKNTAAAHTNGHYISLGGIVGRIANEAFVMDGCDNNCTISNTNTTNTTEIMGGIIGFGAKKGTVKNCSCITTITNSRTTDVIRSGVFGGSWTSGFTISSCSAKGKYGETPITKDNLNTYAFGSGSTFKDVTNITYAE